MKRFGLRKGKWRICSKKMSERLMSIFKMSLAQGVLNCLERRATIRNFRPVQKRKAGREISREIDHYNLDVIISVGYRVKSQQGTQFRIWATQRLREYIVKGFAMDDERLKQAGGGGYFEELLSRIRDIRSSEKVFWRKSARYLCHQRGLRSFGGVANHSFFSRPCKIRCIGRRTARLPRK